jgi:hypothetical protein
VKDHLKRMHVHKDMHGVVAMADRDWNFVRNNKTRKALYKTFTCLKFGHPAQGNRIPIPSCVVSKIRDMYQ